MNLRRHVNVFDVATRLPQLAIHFQVAHGHRLDPGFCVVALNPADRHGRPEGIEQVVAKDNSLDEPAEPVNAARLSKATYTRRSTRIYNDFIQANITIDKRLQKRLQLTLGL
jgi:hypothetical protein